jgi:hypothetical protein
MEIQELSLHTHQMGDQKAFYGRILDLPLLTETPDSFTVQAGRTRLRFQESESAVPPYHVAFTIPRHRFDEAKRWVQQRVPLLHKHGVDELFFAQLNARSFYFCDPAGIILEYIVHYHLNTEPAPAPVASVLHVSEIGLPVQDVPAFADRLDKQCALRPYGIEFRAVRFPRGYLWASGGGQDRSPLAANGDRPGSGAAARRGPRARTGACHRERGAEHTGRCKERESIPGDAHGRELAIMHNFGPSVSTRCIGAGQARGS